MNKEDNTVIVLQKAIRKYKIKVSNTSIKEFLLAHPYYPTLKCISDALKKWRVEHYPLKLDLDEIKDLSMPFIAHLNLAGGQLAFVEKIENGNVFYSITKGRNQIELFAKFAEKLSGAVIVLDYSKNAGEKGFKKMRQNEFLNKMLLPFGIFAILLLGFLSGLQSSGDLGGKLTLIFWGLIITKITGIVASTLLVMHELNIHSRFADKICGFSSKTDCGDVLTSNAAHLFGWFNWADAGLIYFIGTLVYLLGSVGNSSLGYLAIISFISLPYPVFSIYYQSVRLKKFCPFCVLVQLVLFTEFLFLIPAIKTIAFSGFDILRLITSCFIPAIIWVLFKAYYQSISNSESISYSFVKFRRNPEVFRFLLQNNGFIEFVENKYSIILGPLNAPVTLTAFMSLYCGPCAKAFAQLKSLLNNCPEININIIFSVYGDEETQKVVNFLYYQYAEKGSDVTIDFLGRWYSLPKKSRKPLYDKEIIPKQYLIAQQIGIENKKLFEQYKIEGTPAIYVNGSKFPILYEYSDIENYINDIKLLTRGQNRQEAFANSY